MLKYLKMTNVGPASMMELEYGKRLNLLTGDNGLGKSFLLDAAWFALTGKWPAEVNPKLIAGKKALPSFDGKATIEFAVTEKTGQKNHESSFVKGLQKWAFFDPPVPNPGLVLYAMSDGSFAIWDTARNYYTSSRWGTGPFNQSAYVFSPNEVWDGLVEENGKWLCNGLIRDWAGWQKELGQPFKNLLSGLAALSPSPQEKILPGELTRISLDDVRDIPTLRMPYKQDVPILFASSGMRRIIALTYLLVWTWEEHNKAAKLIGEAPTNQIVFLVDEIESHLHPSWQRRIVPAVLKVMETLTKAAEVQLIASTHSPLIMASVEPIFTPDQDAWFDLDLKDSQVSLTHRVFEKQGDTCNWLTSEAFDLASSRNIEDEKLIDDASRLLNKDHPTADEVKEMEMKLSRALPPTDSFLFRWRAICAKKGLLHDTGRPAS